MAYTIYKSDGTAITVPDNTIDAQFYSPNVNGAGKGIGTQLVGRNAIDYGAPVAQNFLQVTENFCGTLPPPNATALQGQLWFDKTNVVLKVNVSAISGTTDWKTLSTIADPSAVTGTDGQVKVNGSVISIWANGAWRQIYPAVYS
jgi:hypothetical protein